MTNTAEAGAEPFCEAHPGHNPAISLGMLASPLPIVGGGLAQPTGLVLRLGPGAEAFEILVVDTEGATLMRLGPFPEDDVVAAWRALSERSGLPLIIEGTDGERQIPCPQIGRVQLGAIRIRRRHGLLSGRRPRFSAKRKPGRLPLRPQVFREREMFGRAG